LARFLRSDGANVSGLITSSSDPAPVVLSGGRPIFKTPQEFIPGTNPQHRRGQTSSGFQEEIEMITRKKRSSPQGGLAICFYYRMN